MNVNLTKYGYHGLTGIWIKFKKKNSYFQLFLLRDRFPTARPTRTLSNELHRLYGPMLSQNFNNLIDALTVLWEYHDASVSFLQTIQKS